MARLGGILLLGVVAVFCQESLADYSSSEVYGKFERLFQDKRMIDIADQVKRDMEEKRKREEKKSDLLEQLSRALQEKKEEHPDFLEREVTSDREFAEREESNEYGLGSNLNERGDMSLYKRLLGLLKRGDLTQRPWFSAKPERTKFKDYENCFLTKEKGDFESLMPYECRYVLNKSNKWADPCKPFCTEWTKEIMKKNKDYAHKCKYDNEYEESYCEKVQCHQCSSGSHHSLYCCGSCLRKGCTLPTSTRK